MFGSSMKKGFEAMASVETLSHHSLGGEGRKIPRSFTMSST